MMQLLYLDETSSTNNYATHIMHSKQADEGTVVLTFRQTNGRGQAQNHWESEDYRNLTFSLILKPDFLPASSQFFLSQVVSLGMSDFLTQHTDSVSIKWPNDILIGNRKVAGLLIENTIMGNSIAWTIAGVGLNMNQIWFQDYSPQAVSLSMVTGKVFDLQKELEEVTTAIMARYTQLRRGETENIQHDYLNRLFRKDEWHTFRSESRSFEAMITGTDEFGRLVLCDRQGQITVWPFKGVEMVFD